MKQHSEIWPANNRREWFVGPHWRFGRELHGDLAIFFEGFDQKLLVLKLLSVKLVLVCRMGELGCTAGKKPGGMLNMALGFSGMTVDALYGKEMCSMVGLCPSFSC